MGQCRFALEQLSHDHLQLALPWLIGLVVKKWGRILKLSVRNPQKNNFGNIDQSAALIQFDSQSKVVFTYKSFLREK